MWEFRCHPRQENGPPTHVKQTARGGTRRRTRGNTRARRLSAVHIVDIQTWLVRQTRVLAAGIKLLLR